MKEPTEGEKAKEGWKKRDRGRLRVVEGGWRGR